MPITRKITAASKRKVAPIKKRPRGQPTKLTPVIKKKYVMPSQADYKLAARLLVREYQGQHLITGR